MAENVVDIVRCFVDELKQIARTESVVGQPIVIGDRTIVPVIKITVGFGAGGGGGEGEKARSGFGGGGGGGARVEPAAFIIMEEDGIRLLPARKGSLEGIIESIPGVIQGIARGVTEGRKGKKDDGEGTDASRAPDKVG